MIAWLIHYKDIFTILFTALSAGVAIVAAGTSQHQFRLTQQRDRQQLAAKVALWYENDVPKYVNTSGLPIWSVAVLFDGRSQLAERGCWPPAPEPIDARSLLGADADTLWREAISDTADRMKQGHFDDESERGADVRFPLGIVFTDGDNRRWRRDFNGILTEIEGPHWLCARICSAGRLLRRVVTWREK
ncbi:hypothetical protein [Saccharopolyspora phatthalungensis]|uniref:Uncharacterized protein n=1 Tax=Saccharopolyspora phatthalungensis TaxID=664693 RepID=A0A840QEY8_9PSEU|nr:hypothetical protein [Saccharopolyspora phatthalungensis]MBB5159384.1 hypothetical protein [Saccharopolyspora phatthalungensis]